MTGKELSRNYKPDGRDNCQTPPEAIELLIPYLDPKWVVWEPAAGEELIVKTLRRHGFKVISSDIQKGRDFFRVRPKKFDIIITNPPYSRDWKFIARCMKLDCKWALLMKSDRFTVERCRKHLYVNGYPSFGLLVPSRRIHYKMPYKGWGGAADFHTSWYTHRLDVKLLQIADYTQKKRR